MDSKSGLYSLRDELTALQTKDHKTPDDLIRAVEIADEIVAFSATDTHAAESARRIAIDNLGAPPDAGRRGSFAAALASAGFDRVRRAVVDVEAKDVVFSPGSVSGAVRADIPAPPLGADARFLYPALPFSGVAPDVTSVASYKQTDRTLPSPVSDMVRDIAAVTPKPELTTTVTVATEPLHQIAVVSTGIPNVLLQGAMLPSWTESDLRFAYSVALDSHVSDEIAAAGPTAAPAGADILESILLAAETVAAEGYAPSILAASPEFLIALRLAVQPGTGDYIFSGNELDLGLRRIAVTGLDTPYVIDPAAVGTLHLSSVRLATFEENNGTTNSSTVRVESNGVFIVQRVGAVAEVAVAS
jgi:hypothetical protein